MKTMTSEKTEVLVAVPSLDSTAGGFVLAARQQDSKTACKVISARAVANAECNDA